MSMNMTLGILIGLLLTTSALVAAKLFAVLGFVAVSAVSFVVARHYAFGKLGVALLTMANAVMWGFAMNVMESDLMAQVMRELGGVFHALQSFILR